MKPLKNTRRIRKDEDLRCREPGCIKEAHKIDKTHRSEFCKEHYAHYRLKNLLAIGGKSLIGGHHE